MIFFTQPQHAEHITSTYFADKRERLVCFKESCSRFSWSFFSPTRTGCSVGNPYCISRKAKDLPRDEWEGRWEERSMPHRVHVHLVGLWDPLRDFLGQEQSLLVVPAQPWDLTSSFSEGLSFHTRVFALYFCWNPLYPGGEPREKKEQVFLIFRPQTKL